MLRKPLGVSAMRVLIIMAALVFSVGGLARLAVAQTNSIETLQRSFEHPPDDAKIMMRWWWFGPTVTKPQLEREMRLMKAGGIGGFEVQPVYPLVPDDPANGFKTLPFLSDGFIDALRFTSEKARELGMRVDLTIGSGWPYGGPMVPTSEASGRLRYEHLRVVANSRRVPLPALAGGEKLIAAFLAKVQGQTISGEGLREIVDIKDGAVWLPDGLGGEHEVLFFISSFTGMQVKRPAIGSEGFVLDHLSQKATANYLKHVGDRLLQAFGSNPPYAIFCDSLEVYGADWTGDLLEEFKRRRGYDLKPYLPHLVAELGPQSKGIRRDWGKTLTELLNERFLAPLRDWSKRNRTLFRIQDYGVPAATLSSNAYADLPEGEGAQWKRLSSTRWASSASHIYGHPVTSSETWTWLHSPVFRATPLDLKAEADLHFLQGINQLIGHGWPYTAEGVEYPGWRFYAAGVFNEKNPWWIVMPDLSLYLQRLSFLLRQGQPANDVAIYLPNDDAWAHFSAGNIHMIDVLRERLGPDLIPKVLEAGYNFDVFDDDSFKQTGVVDNGSLILGKNKYSVVILPYVGRIPIETYRKLDEFARGGGNLIATRRTPLESPGFQATAEDHQRVVEISQRLFQGAAAPGRFVEDEKAQLGSTLNGLLRPDVALTPAAPEVGFIHRRTAVADIYFVANSGNVRQNVKATFRLQGMKAEWWDPFSGKVTAATIAEQNELGPTIVLDLHPYESRVLIFTKRSLPAPQPTTSTAVAPAIDISTDWQVKFGQEGQPVEMKVLRSWTDDETTRFFSGVATYEKEVTVPATTLQKGIAVKLDFGEGTAVPSRALRSGMQAWLEGPIRDAAVVYVNDQRAGSVWCPPYSIDVTNLLRPGQNKIRVAVANLALNYMAGRSLPDYRLLNLRYGERFQAQDMDKVQALPAGLLGSIRLIPVAK